MRHELMTVPSVPGAFLGHTGNCCNDIQPNGRLQGMLYKELLFSHNSFRTIRIIRMCKKQAQLGFVAIWQTCH